MRKQNLGEDKRKLIAVILNSQMTYSRVKSKWRKIHG